MSNTGEQPRSYVHCPFRPCNLGGKGKRHFHCHICTEFVALKVGIGTIETINTTAADEAELMRNYIKMIIVNNYEMMKYNQLQNIL